MNLSIRRMIVAFLYFEKSCPVRIRSMLKIRWRSVRPSAGISSAGFFFPFCRI